MDDFDVRQLSNRELAAALQFAIMAPTNPEAIRVIKEAVRRLRKIKEVPE